MYYLKRKVMGKSLSPEMIAEVDVYRFGPWDLPSKSCLPTRDLVWFFFCPRSKKYANGGRANRSTEHGYWKSTGNDRTVKYNDRPVGKIKTLIFHLGKAPNGDRTNWVMHEYRLEDKFLADKGVSQDAFVICKVYEKSGAGPKNGEHHGAPFVEEEWESDNEENIESDSGLVLHPERCRGEGNYYQSASNVTGALPNVTAASSPSTEQQISRALANTESPPVAVSDPSTVSASDPSTVSASAPFTAAYLPSVETAPLLPVPNETEEDEMDKLFANFGEAETADMTMDAPDNDFFNDLGDLPGWSQLRDGFLELNDLV